jgi:heptaprenylglyceryl phosphate synthase
MFGRSLAGVPQIVGGGIRRGTNRRGIGCAAVVGVVVGDAVRSSHGVAASSASSASGE